jgi:hypothetical protein
MGPGAEPRRMLTGEPPGALEGEPALGLEIGALGAGALAARVVPEARHMPIWPGWHLPPQGGGPALHAGTPGFPDRRRQGMRRFVGGKRVLEAGVQSHHTHAPHPKARGASQGGPR